MMKLRRLVLAMGLAALMGLMAREGRAETIVMTIVTNGHTIPITGALVSSQTSTSFQVNTTALNAVLVADGSAYQFSALGAASDWPGVQSNQGGSLTTSGGLNVLTSGGGVTGSLLITTTEDGFTAPVGPGGTLNSTMTANFLNVPGGGTETYQSSYNGSAQPTPPLSATSSGTTANNYSPAAANGIGAVASGYTLDNELTFNLSQNTSAQAQDGFSGGAQVTVIPEPASIVMMLTGMPLPLVVMGLLRRRRAAA
jgi:hypothetical protein